MAIDMQESGAEHPVTILSESWTGGEAPPPKKSKFEHWMDRHFVLTMAIIVVSLSALQASESVVVRYGSVQAFFALTGVYLLGYAVIGGVMVATVGLLLLLVRSMNWGAFERLGYWQKNYIRAILFIAFVFGFRILPGVVAKYVLVHL